MTKDHAILSLQLPIAEIALLDTEANELPFLTTRSELCRKILQGRHQMVIQATPEVTDLIQQHEQAIEWLEEDKAALVKENQQQVDRLTQQHEQATAALVAENQKQLARLTQQLLESNQAHQQAYAQLRATYNKDVEESVRLQLASEFQARDLTKELKQTTERLHAVEADNTKLAQELKKRKGAAALRDEFTHLSGNLLGQIPGFQEKIKEDGIGSLWNGIGKSASPSEDEKLGQMMRHDFPGPKFSQIVNVLKFLRDQPAALMELVKGKAFVAYLAKKQPANTPKS